PRPWRSPGSSVGTAAPVRSADRYSLRPEQPWREPSTGRRCSTRPQPWPGPVCPPSGPGRQPERRNSSVNLLSGLSPEFLENIHQLVKHGVLASVVTTGDRVGHAILQVVAEDDPADALQGRLGGRELVQDLGAGLLLLQHLVEAAHLPLDPLEAGREVWLQVAVE